MGVRSVKNREVGKEVCLMGNEAFARGAIEAGVNFVSSYPGSPSSEIPGTIYRLAKEFNIYGEWSTNEKVGLEAAGAASLSGLRSLSVMKHNGLNVCIDFLIPFAQQGCNGGMVVIVCDDPSTHSSTNETDSRFAARLGEIPLLEPSNFQEAKDLTKWAFDLSEELKVPVMVRGVTRLSHARGNVVLGEIRDNNIKASLPEDKKFVTSKHHKKLKGKLKKAEEIFENSKFNKYIGPDNPKNIIVAAGIGFPYAEEALERYNLKNDVGILKISTGFPVPKNFILDNIKSCEKVLFIEEIEGYIEERVKNITAQYLDHTIDFYGKEDGSVAGEDGPGVGELNPDIAFRAIEKVFTNKEITVKEDKKVDFELPIRELTFCAGCPHRASYWSLDKALKKDGRGGFAMGDIGCYGLQALMSDQHFMKTLHCMGSGIGMANGFGQMSKFGMDKPVIPVVGDSTFFHSVAPGLMNAKYNGAKFTCLVLDNSATAMTGFQPHPGTGRNALMDEATKVSIQNICEGIGLKVYKGDAYNVKENINIFYKAIQDDEPNVVILERKCALIAFKNKEKPRVYVDTDKCLGEKCGLCSRKFKCPGNIWDTEKNKAKIDDVVCIGCGVCADLCPVGAIIVEGSEEDETK